MVGESLKALESGEEVGEESVEERILGPVGGVGDGGDGGVEGDAEEEGKGLVDEVQEGFWRGEEDEVCIGSGLRAKAGSG